MEQYAVTGMSCAACQTRVEKAVSGVSGVTSCTVNLLTNSLGVEGNATAADIIKAVTDAGYGASEMRKDVDQLTHDVCVKRLQNGISFCAPHRRCEITSSFPVCPAAKHSKFR